MCAWPAASGRGWWPPRRPRRTVTAPPCGACSMNGEWHLSWCPTQERIYRPGDLDRGRVEAG